ncbi:MAG: O-antigen ligase [Aphanizomenon gracile PMC644.10]|nr:O-antigen ligase [Aphanizomenon gracile PMC644.10]
MELVDDALQDIYYYIILVFIGFVYYVNFKPYIYHLFDPLVWIIVNFTFSSTLVIWLYLYNYIQYYYVLSYVMCVLFFLVGYRTNLIYIFKRFVLKKNLFNKSLSRQIVNDISPNGKLLNNPPYLDNINHNSINKSSFDERQLFILTAILSIVSIVTLFYSWQNQALAIFSDNSILDRVALNSQFRWLTVFLSGSYSIGLSLSTFLIFYGKRNFHKKVSIIFFFIFVLSVLTAGSKGAGLAIVFSLGIMQIYMNSIGYKVPKILSKSVYLFMFLAVLYLMYVVTKSQNDNTSWIDVLFFRLAASGDGYIYMFLYDQFDKIKDQYHIITYFLHLFTAPFGIKFIPYNIGVALYGGATGNYSGFGPNPQYVLEGMVFLGLYLAPLYAFSIGCITSFGRNIFMGKLGDIGLIGFIVFFNNFTYIPIDLNNGLFNLFSSILIVSIPYLLSLFLSKILLKSFKHTQC